MNADLRQFVIERAGGICEYCHMPDEFDPLPFCIDHIIAQQHHGPTEESNLALSCFNCNSYKGPNIAGIDSDTGCLTRLFNPREDVWAGMFFWSDEVLQSRNAIGRTTIDVLAINHADRTAHRRLLMAGGIHFD